MMTTSTIAGSSSSSGVGSSSSRRRKKTRTGPATSRPETKWRTGMQERIYGRRLLEALQTARTDTAAPQPLAIKEAADSALALTAKGQSRWSRAILAGRWRRRSKPLLVKAGGKVRGRCRQRKPAGHPSKLERATTKGRRVKDRLRVLGRLVPGCRKLSAPSLLEEAADYVAALEMQVKAMKALADALSAASLTAAAAPPPES